MPKKQFPLAASALLLLSCMLTMGCTPTLGPTLGWLSYPIPVSPYFQDQLEDRAWDKERYDRAPILGPIPPGAEAKALDPPSDDEVMRALEKARGVEGDMPFFYTVQRNNVQIVKELVADHLDPPRVVPLIGPVQLHHARYKCTIYFTETTRVGWPVPYTIVDEDTVEVVYIDHDHFHTMEDADPSVTSGY
jgi:hypothetical protein